MKINELLVESQNLEEGPFANKVGSAIGKAVGTAAKGVGAVAGGIAGLGAAAKKGFAAGKAKVAAAGDDEEDGMKLADVPNPLLSKFTKTSGGQGAGTGAPAAGSAPAAGGAPAAPATKQATAPAGQSAPAPAAPAQGGGAPAQGQAPAAGGAPTGTMYAQVKANIDKLDKKGKQRILQLLQKQVGTAPAATAPAATPTNTMANAPVSKTNKAKPGNPNSQAPAAAPEEPESNAGASAFGQMANTLTKDKPEPEVQKVPPKPKRVRKPSQKTIDADRDRMMGNFSDSIQRHKERMVVEGIANGTVSLYKKK